MENIDPNDERPELPPIASYRRLHTLWTPLYVPQPKSTADIADSVALVGCLTQRLAHTFHYLTYNAAAVLREQEQYLEEKKREATASDTTEAAEAVAVEEEEGEPWLINGPGEVAQLFGAKAWSDEHEREIEEYLASEESKFQDAKTIINNLTEVNLLIAHLSRIECECPAAYDCYALAYMQRYCPIGKPELPKYFGEAGDSIHRAILRGIVNNVTSYMHEVDGDAAQQVEDGYVGDEAAWRAFLSCDVDAVKQLQVKHDLDVFGMTLLLNTERVEAQAMSGQPHAAAAMSPSIKRDATHDVTQFEKTKCPKCGSEKYSPYGSPKVNGQRVRYRKCKDCGHKWTSLR